jgi:MFS family permease
MHLPGGSIKRTWPWLECAKSIRRFGFPISGICSELRQLLDPSQYSQIAAYEGLVIAMTPLDWGIGGLIGRVVADYLGRKRTMMLAILAYSTMTGLSAFCMGLGLLHGSAFLSGRRHRLRMGDWGIVSDWEWGRYENGRFSAAAGLRLRPRDAAKIGQVVLNHGNWNGQQIVPQHGSNNQ